jgi:hypothetical protein
VTCTRFGKKVKDLKNGFTLPKYSIKLENNSFPSEVEKAEAFVDFFCQK